MTKKTNVWWIVWIFGQNPKVVPMADWNAYYRNDDDEEGQDEGEETGGEK